MGLAKRPPVQLMSLVSTICKLSSAVASPPPLSFPTKDRVGSPIAYTSDTDYISEARRGPSGGSFCSFYAEVGGRQWCIAEREIETY